MNKTSSQKTKLSSKKISTLPLKGKLLVGKQLSLMSKTKLSYGGSLLTTRKGRSGGRPIDTRHTMHLVLRSTQAVGEQSFKKPRHARRISEILSQFSRKYGIHILSWANVGNHLHLHLKISNRFGYYSFIRAVTGAIAMAVTGRSRWSKKSSSGKFWDFRPFTRVVMSFRGFLNLKNYIEINEWEGLGVDRFQASLLQLRYSRRNFYRRDFGKI